MNILPVMQGDIVCIEKVFWVFDMGGWRRATNEELELL